MLLFDKKKNIFEAYRTYPDRHIFRFTAYDPPTPLLSTLSKHLNIFIFW